MVNIVTQCALTMGVKAHEGAKLASVTRLTPSYTRDSTTRASDAIANEDASAIDPHEVQRRQAKAKTLQRLVKRLGEVALTVDGKTRTGVEPGVVVDDGATTLRRTEAKQWR